MHQDNLQADGAGEGALTDPLLSLAATTDQSEAIELFWQYVSGHKIATAGLILQLESAYEPERQWPFALPAGASGRRSQLVDAIHKTEVQQESVAVGSPDETAFTSVLVLQLTAGREPIGFVALWRPQTIASDASTDPTLQAWLAVLAEKLYLHREIARLRGSLDQYERGFHTLDSQLRVLDLERQKLAAVLNHSEIGFLVVDADLKITWANAALALTLNASDTGFQCVGQSCNEVICGEAKPCPHCPAHRVFAENQAVRSEITRAAGTGQSRVYTIGVPIRGRSGEVKEVLLMVQDLTGLEALRRSEARYRTLFESSHDAIFMAQPPDFSIVLANPATCSLLGYTQEELAGLTLRDLHAPDEWPRVRASYAAALESGTVTPTDCRVHAADHEVRFCTMLAIPFEFEGKSVVMCNLRDITSRKRAEEDLERSLSLLRGTLESTADGIFVVGQDGTITSYNQKFLQMWRIPDRIAMAGDGERVFAMVRDQLKDPEGFEAKIAELYAHPEAESYDVIEFTDGRIFERYSQPHRIASRSVGRLWSFRDITEQKRAEESLRYRLRFENVVATLSTHFINLAAEEIDDGVEYALKVIGEFAGIDRSYIFLFSEDLSLMSNTHEWCAEGIEAQRQRIQDVPVDVFPWLMGHVKRLKEVRIPRVADLPAAAVAEQEEMQSQGIQSLIALPLVYGRSPLGFLGLDGVRSEHNWSEDVVALLQIAGELLTNALARKRALSEKASLEAQLLQSQKMEAVGTLAGGIAHDFNNVLTGILGYADMLQRDDLPRARIQKAASVIERAARRAAELTQQLLGFARKGKYENVALDLHVTLQEVSTLLARTLEKNITVVQELRADDAVILGDPVQIQQILLNLALNARDAMPEGGRLTFATDRVDIAEEPSGNPEYQVLQEYVKLQVADTGCGIPAEVQSRIFEPFFTTKEQGKGTGMGLSMVYGIVRNHGGSIQVTSLPERGAVFEILLPAAAKGYAAPNAAAGAAQKVPHARILLADDEELVRSVATSLLERMGHKVIVAENGREAVDIYRQRGDEIDLVILDVVMPRMGGRECFRALKEIDPNVHAILSTGYTLDQSAQSMLDEGMHAFVKKPFVNEELETVVSRALASQSAPA